MGAELIKLLILKMNTFVMLPKLHTGYHFRQNLNIVFLLLQENFKAILIESFVRV